MLWLFMVDWLFKKFHPTSIVILVDSLEPADIIVSVYEKKTNKEGGKRKMCIMVHVLDIIVNCNLRGTRWTLMKPGFVAWQLYVDNFHVHRTKQRKKSSIFIHVKKKHVSCFLNELAFIEDAWIIVNKATFFFLFFRPLYLYTSRRQQEG